MSGSTITDATTAPWKRGRDRAARGSSEPRGRPHRPVPHVLPHAPTRCLRGPASPVMTIPLPGRSAGRGMVEAGGVEPPSRSQRLSSVYVRSPPAKISLLGRPWTRCVGASLGEVSSLGPEARRCDQPTGDVSVGPWALPTETGSSIRPPERSCCRHVMLTVPRCWRGDSGSPARGPEASGNRSKPVRPRSEFAADRHPPQGRG